MMIPVSEISEALNRSVPIVITAHKGPDGDALGSTLGLFHALRSAGKDCTVILPDGFPAFIAWMPGAESILCFDCQEQEVRKKVDEAGLIFCLDYNSLDRTGDLSIVLKASAAPKILVDHHPFPSDEFTYSYSDTRPSSTSEMVYELLTAIGFNKHITAESATCLYSGIVTDTGSFRFSCTSPQTHRVAADLIERGAMNANIHNQLFDTQSESRLKLLGYSLSEKMVVDYPNHAAWFVLTIDELKSYNHQKGDTEGLVNYGLALQGIQMAAIFVQHEDLIKISLRSKGKVPVNELARMYFSGGGHTNAAGGKWEGTLESLLAKWKEVLPEFAAKNV